MLINFKEVSKYINNKKILNNINFTLEKNQLTTLIGQNGAGKTTIAKIILGLTEISSGTFFKKENIKIGYIPQEINFNVNLPMNAANFIEILSNKKINDIINNEEYAYLLELINIDKLRKKHIKNLSGGEKQRLIIIASLLNKNDLVILDEPTYWLDVSGQNKFYNILNEYKERYSSSIFMISHDLFTVMKKSDQVICLNEHICCHGSPKSITENPKAQKFLSEIGLYVHSHNHDHDD